MEHKYDCSLVLIYIYTMNSVYWARPEIWRVENENTIRKNELFWSTYIHHIFPFSHRKKYRDKMENVVYSRVLKIISQCCLLSTFKREQCVMCEGNIFVTPWLYACLKVKAFYIVLVLVIPLSSVTFIFIKIILNVNM